MTTTTSAAKAANTTRWCGRCRNCKRASTWKNSLLHRRVGVWGRLLCVMFQGAKENYPPTNHTALSACSYISGKSCANVAVKSLPLGTLVLFVRRFARACARRTRSSHFDLAAVVFRKRKCFRHLCCPEPLSFQSV